jgi:hypothetical protein
MTKEQTELRNELERVIQLAEEIGRLKRKLVVAEEELSSTVYAIQLKWGK